MAVSVANRIMLELNKMDVEMKKMKQEVVGAGKFFPFPW